MQVCGFVDGLVGRWVVGSAYLPLPSLPPFVFVVFCFLDTDHSALDTGTTSAAGERWQRMLKCVGGLFALRI